MEGCNNWAKTSGITSKIGQSAVDKVTTSLNPISKIETNENINKDIKEAAKFLLSHLQNLRRALETLSTKNATKVSDMEL